MPPEAPVTSALFPPRSNMNVTSKRLDESLDVGRRADRDRGEVAVDALRKTAQHAPGAELDELVDACFLHGDDRFAPAHEAGHLLDEEALHLLGCADRRRR